MLSLRRKNIHDTIVLPADLCIRKKTTADTVSYTGLITDTYTRFSGGTIHTFKEIITHIVSPKTGRQCQAIKPRSKRPIKDKTFLKGGFTIEPSLSLINSRTPSYGCAAYSNDAMYFNLYSLYKNLNKHFKTDPSGASIAWVPLTQQKANKVIFYLTPFIPFEDTDKNTKERTRLLRLVNLYVRIPWILLDPSKEAEAYARKVKSALKIHNLEGAIGFTFPVTTIVTPFLHWWISVMLREAFILWSASLDLPAHNITQRTPQYIETAKKLLNAVEGINLTKIVNTHDWTGAKEVWSKIRPIWDKVSPPLTQNQAWSSCLNAKNQYLSSTKLLEAIAVLGGITAFEVPGSYQSAQPPTNRDYKSLQEFYQSLAYSAWSLHSGENTPHAETAFGLQNWLRRTNNLNSLTPKHIAFRVPKAAIQKILSKSISLKPFKSLTALEARTRNEKNVPR